MKRTLREQETILLYNNGDPEAEIYTYDPKLKRKSNRLQRAVRSFTVSSNGNRDGALRCVLPKKWLTVLLREPISEERRQMLSESMKKRNAEREI